MKTSFTKLFSFVILLCCSNQLFSQWEYEGNYILTFDSESEYGLQKLFIDIVSNPDNIWEIGNPDKTNFDTAYSFPNAICTDLNNPYPVNDTSSFIIRNVPDQGFDYGANVVLAGRYQIDSDSLLDYGTIEFSPDNGVTWIDLLTDTIYYQKGCYDWNSNKPVFTGKSDGWTEFYLFLGKFGPEFELGWKLVDGHYVNNDTVAYRFTFISDGNDTGKDGWILDDLHFEDWMEAIKQNTLNTISSKAYPNPFKNSFTIEFENLERNNFFVTVFDINGRILLKTQTSEGNIEIPFKQFQSGIYYYRIGYGEKISFGKIVKQD